MRMFAFDSFQGLPNSEDDHDDVNWVKGAYSAHFDDVKRNTLSNCLKVEFIKGFYEESLNETLMEKMKGNPPSIVHIDVDLYSSAITVLKWLDQISLPMTIYIFDDIWAIGNHPNLGEPKAIREYNSQEETRGFLVESHLSLGSKSIYSFTLKDHQKHSNYC